MILMQAAGDSTLSDSGFRKFIDGQRPERKLRREQEESAACNTKNTMTLGSYIVLKTSPLAASQKDTHSPGTDFYVHHSEGSFPFIFHPRLFLTELTVAMGKIPRGLWLSPSLWPHCEVSVCSKDLQQVSSLSHLKE